MERPNWVLVDYENIQAIDWDLLAGSTAQVVLFCGVNQKTVPIEVLSKGLKLKQKLILEESAGNGKNALDYQMAFYAGRIAESCPNAYLHFVTRDTGFNALVNLIKKQTALSADRVEAIANLKFLNPVNFEEMTLAQRADLAASRLQKMRNARPKKKKTLLATLSAFFGKQLSEPHVEAVFQELVKRGKVIFEDKDVVRYPPQ